MKKLLLIGLATFFFVFANAQDSVKHTSQTYISLQPSFYTTSTGGGAISASAGQRTTFDIEIGRQWDVISLGLDLGLTSLEKNIGNDTVSGVVPAGKYYVEVKPNLNVFQQGKFTNTITIGFGYVFGSAQSVLNEFTTGIEYDANPRFSYNVNFGTYYFTGNGVSSNQNFFGFSVVYLFKNRPKKFSAIN